MAGFFYEMEKVIKINSDNALELALHYYGQVITLSRQSTKNDSFSKVHGKNAGADVSIVKRFDGVLQADDFSTSDGYYTSNFEEGYLYTKEQGLMAGDILTVDAGGGVRVFKIESKEDIGYSTDMFIKWRLSNKN